jgi:hypothetical protein
MKKIFIIGIIVLIFNGCMPNSFKYKITISKNDKNIIEQYKKKYQIESFLIKGNHVYSNNQELLKKIKIRISAIDSLRFDDDYYFPFIINYNEKYYHVLDFENIRNINWLNDEEIYNNLFEEGLEKIEINIPNSLNELTENEFKNNYFEKMELGSYKSKMFIEKVLFKNDEDKEKIEFMNILLFLSSIKYQYLVKATNSRLYIQEIKTE